MFNLQKTNTMHKRYRPCMKEMKRMQEIMKPALKLSEKDKEMFEKIKVAAVKQSKATQVELKKTAESLRNFKNPINKKETYIENKYTRFFNQYKYYFKERGIITTEVFHEFWTWFTRCLYPGYTSLLLADIKEYHFKLFHEYKIRLFEDMKWDNYKEAHLLDIYDKESNNYWLARMKVSTEIKNEISKKNYHTLLNQYLNYFSKKYYEKTLEFSVFLIWVAKCLHPNESLENVVITDKDTYQFIEYINIIQDNYNWSDEEERERLKERLDTKAQTEQTMQQVKKQKTLKERTGFSITQWCAILYYANSTKMLPNAPTFKEKTIAFMETHLIDTKYTTFKSKYYETRSRINKTKNYSRENLSKIIPFMIERYRQAVPLINDDLLILKNEEAEREKF